MVCRYPNGNMVMQDAWVYQLPYPQSPKTKHENNNHWRYCSRNKYGAAIESGKMWSSTSSIHISQFYELPGRMVEVLFSEMARINMEAEIILL